MPVSARLLGRRILAVELDDLRVVVEPGVTNLALSRAVAPTHFYPPDPSSQIVCSIGGKPRTRAGLTATSTASPPTT
jgi:glycolate oxidase